MESGVVFYDPEGKEVVVPSSKVGAFKAALEAVNEFEPESCRVEAASSAGCAIDSNGPADDGCQNAEAVGNEDTEVLRQEVKTNLQKRYFALLHAGFEPNEAAARAILEAAGHAPGKEVSEGACPEPVPKACGGAGESWPVSLTVAA